MDTIWSRKGYIWVVIILLLSACDTISPIRPDSEVKKVFEDWALQAGVPYKNVTYQTINNDDAFATVRVQADLRESANENWVKKQVDVECRHIGSKWKCSSDFVFVLMTEELSPPDQTVTPVPTIQILIVGTTQGSSDAPVLVEVWQDFQCPACRKYSEEVEPLIIDTYVTTGKVRYVFRHYPFLDDQSTTKESDQAANASMCAADQGRFWDYHDILFANWNGENGGAFSDKRLVEFAESIALDMDKFNLCFQENRYKAQINQDLQDGTNTGVKGTPSVFVNRQIISPGVIPSYEEIASAIDIALANSGN